MAEEKLIEVHQGGVTVSVNEREAARLMHHGYKRGPAPALSFPSDESAAKAKPEAKAKAKADKTAGGE